MSRMAKTDLFEKIPISKAAAQLCVPTVISALVMACYSLADTLFVGMLNDPLQNAAVTLAAPALMLFDCCVALFGVGAASFISRSLGKKDYDAVYKVSCISIWLGVASALCFALVFTVFYQPILRLFAAEETMQAVTGAYLKWTFQMGAVPYILYMVISNLVRAEGAARQSSIGVIGGCILNILLDPFFVMPWGLGMGAEGAGCASFLAHCFSCLYFLTYLICKKDETFIRMMPAYFKPSRSLLKEICAVGVPAMINKLLTVSSQLVLNSALAQYGPNVVAAMGIAFRVDIIPLDACVGLSQGIMPLVGYNYSSGNIDRMKKGIRFIIDISMALMVGIVALYCLFPKVFVELFIANPIVVQYGAQMLRGMCLALPLYCYSTVVMGTFQACGFGGKSLFLTFCRQVLLMIPSILILDYLLGWAGIAYSYLTAEVVVAMLSAVMIRKFYHQFCKT